MLRGIMDMVWYTVEENSGIFFLIQSVNCHEQVRVGIKTWLQLNPPGGAG